MKCVKPDTPLYVLECYAELPDSLSHGKPGYTGSGHHVAIAPKEEEATAMDADAMANDILGDNPLLL
jgi:hypothetical protein